MQFISPRTDFAFKRIFGSENSKKTCISFLNAILDFEGTEKEIIDLEILNPWNAPKIKGLKDTYLDVKVKTTQEKYIIIEMQVLNVDCFKQRVLYNAAKAYANQIGSGSDYNTLIPVIALTIVDFDLIKETENYISSFHLKEKVENFEYSQDFELVFLELPKFKKTLAQLKTHKDKWIYFLKEVDDLSTIPETYKEDNTFDDAFYVAEKVHISKEDFELLEGQSMFIADQKNALTKAKKDGVEEGMEKGREEGIRLRNIEIAKKLLEKNIDISVIQISTGLTKKEIEELK